MYDTAYPSLIAQQLNCEYVNRSKPTNSNHKIARMVLSYTDYQPGDVVLAEWTSTTRHEFRTNQGWQGSKNGYTVTDHGLHPLEDAHIAAAKLWQARYAQALGI